MEKMCALKEQLRSPDEETRRLAVVGLSGYPLAEAKEGLLSAMGDGSWRIRKEAVDALLTVSVSAEVMEELVAMLRSHENAGLRNSAIEALERLGAQAVPILCRHADDDDHGARRFIIDILGSIGAAESVPLLIRALDDTDQNVCVAAAENLGKIGDARATPHLLQALAKPDVWLRYTILEALVKIGDPVPMAAVTPLLSENLLKKAVFDCLGALGDSETAPLLVEGLKERGRTSREAAAAALVKLRERLPDDVASRAVDARLKGLKGSPFMDGLLASLGTSDISLNEALIKLVGIIGDERATNSLLRGCRDSRLRGYCLQAFATMGKACATPLINAFPSADVEERRFIAYVCGELRFNGCVSLIREGMRDADPLVRKLSGVAAGKAGLTALFDEIVVLLDDPEPEARQGAIEALTCFAEVDREAVLAIALKLASAEAPEGRRDAVILFTALHDTEKLSLFLKDEDAAVRKTAVVSLAELKARKYMGLLVMALADEEPEVRFAAAGALGEIGREEALEPLFLALEDEDPWVKCSALKSLGKLGNQGALPAVMEMLDKADGPVMIAALEALEAISGDDACELIKRELENPDEEVVKAAIEILSRLDCAWLGEYRARLLFHPHWDVRVSFIRAMAGLWGGKALPDLLSALENEPDELVRGRIVEILGRMQ